LAAGGEVAAARAEALGPAILALQGRLAEAEALARELRREATLAESEYLGLAAKVEQARIAAQDAVSNVRIASRAAMPTEASGLGRATLTLMAAALGFLLAVGAALLWEWWQAPRLHALTLDHKPEQVAVA
jgi:uncharacterized protein involved in exopolysaccharide biosynthesis